MLISEITPAMTEVLIGTVIIGFLWGLLFGYMIGVLETAAKWKAAIRRDTIRREIVAGHAPSAVEAD